MKAFLIDSILVLLIGLMIIVIIPSLFAPKTTVIIEILTIITWSIMCKGLLLLPIDLIRGKKTILCYYHSCLSIHKYEFYRNRGYYVWMVELENTKLTLCVPASLPLTDVLEDEIPPKGQLIKVDYYPYSRILCDWTIVTQETNDSGIFPQ